MGRTPLTEKLEAHLGWSHDCECGTHHEVATGRVIIEAGLVDDAGPLVEALVGRGGEAALARVLLVADRNTWSIAGERIFAALDDAGVALPPVILGLAPPGEDHAPAVKADEGVVAELVEHVDASPRPSLLLAVGSGTVNDIVKMAAAETALPCAVFATAPSMNGYTSAIAAIEVGGVKRTLPAPAPLIVAADPEVLAAAPVRMARSGLADLLSKPVASADWRLAHLLRGDPYCERPVALVDEAVEAVLERAGAIGTGGDPDAGAILFEALLLSGMSMAAAGSSAPASGGEHLISHFLDMTAPHEPGGPRTPALHGEQVGVGTRVSLRLYRELLSLSVHDIDWEAASRSRPDGEAVRARLEDEAGFLPEEVREEILEQAAAKSAGAGPVETWQATLRERWEDVRADLGPRLEDGARYEEALTEAGCPATAAAIGVPAEALHRAVRLARFIRDRYTVLDLAADLGRLDARTSRILEGIA